MARDKNIARNSARINSESEDRLSAGDAHSVAHLARLPTPDGPGPTGAPTTLFAGQIAFTAFQSDNTGGAGGDYFQFVLLTAVNAGTTIYFTDCGSRTDNFRFMTNENLLRWVAQSDLPAGTLISFTATGGAGVVNTAEWTGINPGTGGIATNAQLPLNTGGDNITAFVSPVFAGSDNLGGTAIAALAFGQATFSTTYNTSGATSQTGLPGGLTDGVNAVSIAPTDNGRYTGTTSGTASALRSAINTDTNWATSGNPLSPHGVASITVLNPGMLSVNDVTLAEGNSGITSFVFTITRTGGSDGAVGATWTLTTFFGGNVDAADFVTYPQSGTVSFANGETSQQITIQVQGDTAVEPDEAFTVTLSAPTGGVTTSNLGVGRILNDDVATLSIDDVSHSEGDSGSTVFTFTVTRSGASAGTVGATWTIGIANSGDLAAGQLLTGSVSFADGEISKTILVNVRGEYFVEGDDTFTVTLSAPTGGVTIADATGVGTIVNDDVRGAVSIDDVSHSEGDDNLTTYTFTVSRTGQADGASVDWAISAPGGAGNAGVSDFVLNQTLSGTITFVGGETSRTITVQVLGNHIDEGDEAFTITLSNPAVGTTIADGSATGTILDDDTPSPYTPDGNETIVNQNTDLDQTGSRVAWIDAGHYVVTWTSHTAADNYDVMARLFNADGTPAGDEFQVNTTSAGDQVGNRVATLSGGGFVIVWSDVTSHDSHAQMFNADGTPDGTELTLNADPVNANSVPWVTALPGGGFAAVWMHDEGGQIDIRGRTFDADGQPVSAEFAVNTETALNQQYAQMTTLANGHFVVVWHDASGAGGDASGTAIKMRVFDSDGTALTDETLVNTAVTGIQQFPAVGALAGGGYVVAWEDNSLSPDDISGNALRAQIYDASGNPVGGELLVNATTYGSSSRPTITGLPGGGFVIGWWNQNAENQIHALVFDATGNRIGGEFEANSDWTGDQLGAAFAASPVDGHLVATWTDFNDSEELTDGEIEQRLFTLDQPPSLSLGNRVFLDANGNGTFDDGEGKDGVTVELLDDQGNVIGTTTTADGGEYLFTGLAEGDYQVRLPFLPPGWTSLAGAPDPDDNVDHDDNGDDATITSGLITLSEGGEPTDDGDSDPDTNLTVDFGFYIPPPTIDLDGPGGGTGYAATFVEGAAGVAIVDSDLDIVSAVQIVGITATITDHRDGDLLEVDGAFASANIIATGYNAATGGITLSAIGEASAADFEEALTHLRYRSTSSNPTDDDTDLQRTISFVVDDGFHQSAPALTTIAITADNAPAVIGGTISGAVAEDGADSTGGQLTISDPDSADTFQAFGPVTGSGGYGAFSLTESGLWSYLVDNGLIQFLGAGDTATDTIDAVAADGTVQALTVTITGANDAAMIDGDDTGAVTEDGGMTATGTLTANDVDTGESSFLVQSSVGTAYGTFSLDGSGNWSYSLNNAHPDVQALNDGQTLTDTVLVKSFDGTTHNVVITINGADEPPVTPPSVDLDGTTGAIDFSTGYTEGNLAGVAIGDMIQVTQGTLPITSATITLTDPAAGDALVILGSLPVGIINTSGIDSQITLTGIGSAADWAAALAAIRFVSSSDNPDDYGNDPLRTITVQVSDGANPSGVVTAQVTIDPVNDDPVLGGLDGDSVTWTEGDPYVVLDNNAPIASVSDVDNQNFDGGFIQVGVQINPAAEDEFFILDIFPGVGTIGNLVYVDSVHIGTITAGGPGAILTISLNEEATAARVATLLDYIAYRNVAGDNPTAGDRSVSWLLNDGHGGAGAAVSTVTVAAVDDPAVIDVPADNVTWTEQDPAVLLDASLTVTDVDGPTTIDGATVAVSSGFVQGEDVLTFDVALATSLGINVLYDHLNGVLTLENTASLGDYEQLLRTVRYANVGDPDNPTAGDRVIDFAVTGGPPPTGDSSVTVHVEAIDDPTVDLNGPDEDDTYFDAAYSEGGAAAAIADTDVAITSDSGLLTGATITITDPAAGDLLSIEGILPGLITALYDPDTATLTLSGQGTVADYQAALAQLRYSSTSEDPDEAGNDTQRTIEIVVADGVSAGTPSSAPVYAYVAVTGVIDNPAIADLDGDLATYTEGDAFVLLDASGNATVTDLDNMNFSGGRLTVSFNGTGLSQDRFDVISNGVVQLTPGSVLVDEVSIGSWDGGGPGSDFTVNFNGDATPERIQALLHALAYRNGAGDAPIDGLRAVLITLTDGDGGSVSTASQVQVVAVNDAPLLDLNGPGDGTGSTGSHTENGGNTMFASAATVSDPDSADFAGGQLTATVTGNGDGFDHLHIFNQGTAPGQVGADSGIVTYGGVAVGSYAGGFGALDPLVVTFNAAATSAIVQAVARMLAYSTGSENPSTLARTVQVVLTDGDGGTSAPATAVIAITAVNDAPEATGKTITVAEDTPKTLGAADFPFTDPENHGLFSVTIVTVPGAGTLFYDADGPGGAGLPVAVLAGATFSAAQLGGARLTYVPPPNASGTGYASFTYTVRDDGGTDHGGLDTDASPATIVFNVTPFNDAPGSTGLDGDSAAYTEDDGPGLAWLDVGRDAVISDVDSADFDGGSLTVSIIVNKVAGEDQLVLDTSSNDVTMVGNAIFVDSISIGTISADGVGLDRVITFNSGATAALVSRLIQNFSYVNTNQSTPSTALRLVEFRLADGDGGTMFTYTSVSVTAVDDAPVIANFDHDDVTFVEGSGPIRLDLGGDALVSDVDSNDFDGGYLQVLLGEGVPSEDVIGFATSPETGITLSDGTNSGSIVSVGGVAIGSIVAGSPTANAFTVNFNANADAADVTALLQALTYLNTNTANPSTLTRAIVVFVSDGDGGPQTGAVANVHVTGVNDAPTITNLQGNSGTLVEGNFDAIFIDDGRNAVISEPDSANYNGGSLTLTVTSGFSAAGDRVGIISDGTLSVGPGNVVRVGGVAIGVVSGGQHGGGSADTMVINFNTDNATVARVQTLLRGLFFANGTQQPVAGTRNFRVDLVDGDGVANEGADRNSYMTSILVIEVNDAPSGADATRSTAEDTPYVFAAADFGFSDIQNFLNVIFTDDGNALAAVIVTTLPLNGILYLDPDGAGTGSLGTAVVAGQEIAVADINAGRLVFVAAANGSGSPYASFNFQVKDDGGIDNNGVDTDASPNTMTLQVNAVNDAPSGTSNAFTIDEDATFTFAESHFGFSDPVEGDDFLGVVITTTPTAGTILLDGVAVAAGQFVSLHDIALGKLTFAPVPDAGGAPYASFTFQVRDDGGTLGSGQDTDQSANTISFTVTALNDAPVNTVPGSQIVGEDLGLTLGTAGGNAIQVADVDATTLTVTLSVAHGTLTLASATGLTFSGGSDGTADATMTFSGSAAAINAALGAGLTYNPASNFNGADAISIVTTDNGQTGTGSVGIDSDSVAISIVAANDPVSATGPANFAASEEISTAIPGLSVGDVDALLAPDGLYRVLFETDGGTLSLSTLTGLTFSTGDGTDDAGMDFVGTIADINAALATASFTGGLNLAGTFDLTLQITDQVGIMVATGSGLPTTATHDFTVTIAGINDAPVNILPAVTQIVNEDIALTFNSANGNLIQVSDVDAGAGNVTVTLAIADGALTLATTSGLSVTGNGTSNIVLTGTLASVNAALDGLQYLGALNAYGGRTLTVTTSDNGHSGTPGALGDTDIVSITINPVNDAPSGTSKTVTASEDDPYIFSTADFGFSDAVEGHALLAVRIATLATDGELRLDGVAIVAGQSVSAADIQAGRLAFVPAANEFGTGYASFTFQVQDDGGILNGGVDLDPTANTIIVNVTPDNLAPILDLDAGAAGVNAALAYTENDPAASIAPAATLTDDSADFSGGTVTAHFIANGAAEDQLSIRSGGGILVSSTDDVVIYGGVAIGSWGGGVNGADLVVQLNGNATAAAVEALLRAITYANVSDTPSVAARTIEVAVSDGDGGASSALVTVNLLAVDDAAVAHGDAFTIDENAQLAGSVFLDHGAGADADVDGPALAVSAVNGASANVGQQILLASGALLKLNANGSFTYDTNHAFDHTPTGSSGASNTPAFDSFTYRLAGGNTVTVTITLTGLDTNDWLLGTSGADTLSGGAGDDIYFVDGSADDIIEAVGGGHDYVVSSGNYVLNAGAEVEIIGTNNNDGTAAISLNGNEYGQVLVGNAGANYLDGGGGADLFAGLGGNDTYIVDADDRVYENAGGGYDNVAAKVSYALLAGQEVEVLSTSNNAGTAAISLNGNEYGQVLVGNAGANYLDGGGGADLFAGLGGNDTYIVDADDRVYESGGGGHDNVAAKVSYALLAGQEVEVLSTSDNAGTAAINLYGNEYGQVLVGNAGANYLDGGGGVDLLVGLGGNDTYIVDADDRVFEGAGGGSDSVAAKVSYVLELGQEIELLSTTDNGGTAAIDLTGNAFGQVLLGNAGANILDGGLGNDLLVGLGGADTFAFTTALGAGNVDTINDMAAGTDKIALDDAVFTAIGGPGALNANAFATGAGAADASDRIIYNSATGQLFYDADGNGGGAQVQFATLTAGLALTASDFQVI